MSGIRATAVEPSLRLPACLAVGALFACPSPSSAQGLTGGLEGLLPAYLMVWAALAIVPGAMLVGALLVKRDERGGRRPLAWLLATPAILYIPTSIPWVFVPDALVAGKLCAVAGFALLHGVIELAVTYRSRLRRNLHVASGIALVVLLVIPTSFWERPLVRFRAVSLDDNLAGLDAQGNYRVAYAPDYWLALDDGRRLFQTASLDGGPFEPPRSPPFGPVVVLEPAASPDGQERFELTFYDRTGPYRHRLSDPAPRLTIPLLRVHVDMYEAKRSSYAVLLDRDTEVDYPAELVTALELGGDMSSAPETKAAAVWQSWVRRFVELGEIDVESPGFLDLAFASEKPRVLLNLLRMGMAPDAVDSDGNTVLHVAARKDSSLFERLLGERLLGFDVDPDRRNDRGRTPLDEARRRYGGGPEAWRVESMERAVEAWRSRQR